MRGLQAVFLPSCVVILLMASFTVPLPVFVEQPGNLLSLTEHVDVDLDEVEEAQDAPLPVDGDFLLTLVNLRRATVFWLVRGLVDPDLGFLFAGQLTGGVDDVTYFDRQREVFASTADVAAAVALEAAGFPVESVEPSGALVAEVMPGAAVEGSLEPGDVVTAVGDSEVRSASELVAAVRRARGPTVEIEFVRADRERRVEVEPRQIPGLDQPGLGVRAEDKLPPIELPVPVAVDTGRIGGPSAGLMIALTVFDTVSPEALADGRQIAGTGGITMDGTVTPIGGISLKVLSAHREGADVFLAPLSQLSAARAALPSGSRLDVVGVGSFRDAVEALRDGSVPAVHADLAVAA